MTESTKIERNRKARKFGAYTTRILPHSSNSGRSTHYHVDQTGPCPRQMTECEVWIRPHLTTLNDIQGDVWSLGGHYVLTNTKSVLTNRLAVHTRVCSNPGHGNLLSREGGDPRRRIFCVHNRGSGVSVPRVTCNDLEKDQTQGKYAVTTSTVNEADQTHGHD